MVAAAVTLALLLFPDQARANTGNDPLLRDPLPGDEVIEEMACELRASQDGSNEELFARQRVERLIALRDQRGLNDHPAGAAHLRMAMIMSGCKPVELGATHCETLANHRYSRVDAECRRLFEFEDRRYEPATLPFSSIESAEDWFEQFLMLQAALALREEFPTLTRGGIDGSDPRISGAAMAAIPAWIGWFGVVGGTAASVVTIAAVVDYFDMTGYHADERRLLVLSTTAKAVMTDLKSITQIRDAAEREVRRINDDVDRALVEAGFDYAYGRILHEELNDRIALHERARDESTAAVREAEKNDVEAIAQKAQQKIEELEAELRNVTNPLLGCEASECVPVEFRVDRSETYRNDLRRCRNIYGPDDTVIAGDGTDPQGLGPASAARLPACSAGTFERILNQFDQVMTTAEDAFGAAGDAIREQQESLQAEFSLEQRQRAKEEEYKNRGCSVDNNACGCTRIEAEMRELYAESVPGALAGEVWRQSMAAIQSGGLAWIEDTPLLGARQRFMRELQTRESSAAPQPEPELTQRGENAPQDDLSALIDLGTEEFLRAYRDAEHCAKPTFLAKRDDTGQFVRASPEELAEVEHACRLRHANLAFPLASAYDHVIGSTPPLMAPGTRARSQQALPFLAAAAAHAQDEAAKYLSENSEACEEDAVAKPSDFILPPTPGGEFPGSTTFD